MDTELYNLLNNLGGLRKRYKLSKKEMCKIMKVGISTLNKIEKGVFPERLGANSIIRASKYINVSLKDLFLFR